MSNNLTSYDCGDDDVIAFGESMYRAGKIKGAIARSFDGSLGRSIDQKLRQNGIEIPTRMIGSTRLASEHCQWFEDGIGCDILDLNTRSWRKGNVRLKVSVEFFVEEDRPEQMLLPPDTPTTGNIPVQTNGADELFDGEYVFSEIHNRQS
jgi:hypothetical protein